MKRLKLADMTVDQLVERFTAITLDQDKAILRNEHAKFNRLFSEMEAVKQELRARSGDQRVPSGMWLEFPRRDLQRREAI